RNGMGNSSFALRLIDNIGRLAPASAGHPEQSLILEHLERVAAHAAEGLPPADRQAVEAAAGVARAAFQAVRKAGSEELQHSAAVIQRNERMRLDSEGEHR